jgi:hypothetical protein
MMGRPDDPPIKLGPAGQPPVLRNTVFMIHQPARLSSPGRPRRIYKTEEEEENEIEQYADARVLNEFRVDTMAHTQSGRHHFGVRVGMPDPPSPVEWLDRFLSDKKVAPSVFRRRPYIRHKDNLEALEWVFQALSDKTMPRGTIVVIHHTVNVPLSTLYTWYKIIRLAPNWRPTHKAYADAKRVFTDPEEYELLHRVHVKFLDKGLVFCDADFRLEALKFRDLVADRLEKQAETNPAVVDRWHEVLCFRASAHFAKHFRHRHVMSLRRPSLKRRPVATDDEIQQFINTIHEILWRTPPDRVINIDETNWRMVAAGFLTWAKRGTESVTCHIEDDAKFGVTSIAGIDAAGSKLPLTVIGKGKTRRCLTAYHLPETVNGVTSPSGWTTNDVMCEYFTYLKEQHYPEGRLVIVLDTYSAHRAEIVKNAARGLGFKLKFIPPGCTDRLQPLDRRVFGVMKSYGRQQWRRNYHANEGGKTTRAQMAQNLVEAWDRITPEVIDSAWNIYWTEDGGDEGPDEKEDPKDPTYVPTTPTELD